LSGGRVDEATQPLHWYDFGDDLVHLSSVLVQRLPPGRADAAVKLAEHWRPILQFTEAAKLDEVDGYWFLACMRVLQADLEEAGL